MQTGVLQIHVVKTALEADFEDGSLRFSFGAASTRLVRAKETPQSLVLDAQAQDGGELPRLQIHLELAGEAASVAEVDVAQIGKGATTMQVSLAGGSVELEMSWVAFAGFTPTQTSWSTLQRIYHGATRLPVVGSVTQTTEQVVNWSLQKTGAIGLLLPKEQSATDVAEEGSGEEEMDLTPLGHVDARLKELFQVVDDKLDRPISVALVRAEFFLRAAAKNPYVRRSIELSKPVGTRLPYISQLYDTGSAKEVAEAGGDEKPEPVKAVPATLAPQQEETKTLDVSDLPDPAKLEASGRSLSSNAATAATAVGDLVPSTPQRSISMSPGKRGSFKKRFSQMFNGSKEKKSTEDLSDKAKKQRRASFSSPFSRKSLQGTM